MIPERISIRSNSGHERRNSWFGSSVDGPRHLTAPSTSAPRAWTENVHEDDREHVIAAWRESVSTGDPFDHELRMRTALSREHCAARRDQPGLDVRGDRRPLGTAAPR
ncbi:MAG: PAS domain-containing protein [Thermoanaerobaculia bacterium]